MALRVWLPLDGDLRNLGASNVEVANNGATVNSAGKIGKCYYFDGTTYIKENTYDWTNFNTATFSLCCWYKEPSPVANGNSQMICIGTNSGWNNIRIGLLRRTSNGYPMFSVSDGTNNVNYNCTVTSFSLDTWNHIACTYNNGEIKIYLNGILNKTYTTTITAILNSSQHLGIGAASNGAEKLTGYLNDVRIYDHCLSAAEVHEIAQGLVLHYKLNQNITIGENLMPNSLEMPLGSANPSTGTWRTAGSNNMTRSRVAITDTPEGSGYGFQNSGIQTANDGSCYGIDSFPLEANTNYIISMWARITAGTEGYAGFNVYASTPLAGWQVINKNYYSTKLATNGSWTKCWMSFKTNTATTRNIYIGITTGDTNVTTQMCNVHIEKGSLTDYNIITDSSGYGHNGTIIGDLISSSDTKRYSTSTRWNCSSPTDNSETGICYIQTPFTLTTPLQLTIAWWAKPESGYGGRTNHAAFCTSNNSSRPIDYDLTAFHHRDSGFDIYPSDGSGVKRLSFTYIQNEWHHYVITYDGTTAKSYKDGVLQTNVSVGTNKTLATFSQLYIGYSQAGGVRRKTLGNYSDFRIYCTPLLDTDIKQLYNIGMKVDNLGGVHGFEFIEQQFNMIFPIELSRSNLQFTNGLNKYTQANCQVTLTDQGYHIYRPPNLTLANDGSTMYGGLKLVNQKTDTSAAYDNTRDNNWGLQKGHTYFAAFHAKGKSSNSASWAWSNNMGWSGGGINASPTIIINTGIPSNFQGEKDCIFIFTINDDIAKNCTSAYSSYVVGTTYLSYRHLAFNWAYGSTGELGTDLYLTNLRLYDITNDMAKITKQGQAKFYDFVEQADKAQIRKNSELLATEFIEM